MRFKKTTRNLDFADLSMANCMEPNRSIKLMEQLNKAINWVRVESILPSHYTVGSSEEGARAYPPLMLFKCLMLQKWFRIPSDPELEN
jgi:transposase, IS5 family